ncbi:MAG TPA: adenylate/guanylate cyclase domain-containing protein [Burkholderiaceae bacterium]
MRSIVSEPRYRRALFLAASLAAVLAVWLASNTRPWHALEFRTFDLYTALAAPRKADPRIVILAIDEPTFQQLETQWPFPRAMHGALLDRLQADGAKAVGFDVVFADPAADPLDDAALTRAIAASKRVVLAATRESVDNRNASMQIDVLPLPALLQAGGVPGYANVMPDDDFVVRRQVPGEDSYAARLAVLAGAPPASSTPDLIAYAGPYGTFDTRSYYQALLPGLLPAGFFRDKIVLIGRSAQTAGELQGSRVDMFNSPFGSSGAAEHLIPGVEIQANLLSNRLHGDGYRLANEWWSVALVLAMIAALARLDLRAHPAASAAAAAALLAGTAVLSYALFTLAQLWLPPLLPMAAVAAFYGTAQLANYVAARKRALETRRMFSQYVPPAVVDRLIAQPELLALRGDVRELTLMFTDLANFTAMSEQLSAERTVDVLTEYFDSMTPIIHKHGGTIDKFIGDAVMAFWGAPLDDARHAEHAVLAAIEMAQEMDALGQRLAARGLPLISMRIGLHTGRVVVGNVGSKSRFSYTAIGDAVNLAARLEGANKAFGTRILLSGATAAQLPAEVALRHVDTVIVKGKSEAIDVYTPCADAKLCELSREAIGHFALRKWEEAERAFTALLKLAPGDPAALRFLERIAEERRLPDGAPWVAAVALDKL